MKQFVMLMILLCAFSVVAEPIFIEAEGFADKGGWIVDAQFIEQMGSPYLLAHGMGEPVKSATTKIEIPKKGKYYLWVRTKDWAPFPTGPGAFQIKINGEKSKHITGADGNADWHWQYAGQFVLKSGQAEIEIEDLSGFEGRFDALYLTTKKRMLPPEDQDELAAKRAEWLNLPTEPELAGDYDFVVVGGGMAGICAAVQASRLGLKTALIQNRPVLGGNNSSEIRVHLMGDVHQNHYPKLGRIVRELDNGDPGNANEDAAAYGDIRKLRVVQAEPNLDLFLNTHALDVKVEDDQITAVIAVDIPTGRKLRFNGKLFADCTGDASIGFHADADYRIGRESREQTQESMAPEQADNFTMGTSNLWNSKVTDEPSEFPACPWALQFSDEYHWEATKADWRWETGFGNFHTIDQAEEIRDHNFRAVYGNWSYLKNHKKEEYAHRKLNWVANVGGKRESRRLLGDIILTQQDLQTPVIYKDGIVTTTWSIDLHFPDSTNSQYFKGQEFISWYKHPHIKPYPVPYRCLYSRNINNLFVAGRNISVTHVALGTIRVMRTGGMMGELVGMAAAICKEKDALPRDVYEKYLDELLTQFEE